MSSPPAPEQPQFRSIRLAWYALALIGYIATAYVFKAVVMNWILGPLFLLVVLYVLPTTLGKVYAKMWKGPVG